jgi:hypothetical protein
VRKKRRKRRDAPRVRVRPGSFLRIIRFFRTRRPAPGRRRAGPASSSGYLLFVRHEPNAASGGQTTELRDRRVPGPGHPRPRAPGAAPADRDAGGRHAALLGGRSARSARPICRRRPAGGGGARAVRREAMPRPRVRPHEPPRDGARSPAAGPAACCGGTSAPGLRAHPTARDASQASRDPSSAARRRPVRAGWRQISSRGATRAWHNGRPAGGDGSHGGPMPRDTGPHCR